LKSSTVSRTARIYDGLKGREEQVAVVHERPLTIVVNRKELVTLLTDGSEPEELALGFLRN